MDIQDNQAVIIKISELESLGLNSKFIIEEYFKQNKRELNLNELIKVSPYDEARNIKLETFDSISVLVPVHMAAGTWNKIE